MSTRNLFAYEPTGSLIVTVDGPELLVHLGEDGQPHWRRTAEAPLIGVGTSPDEVVTLDEQGKLVWWEAADGERNDEVQVEGPVPAALAVDRVGIAAVLVGNELRIVEPGEQPRTVELPGACSLAWSEDGALLGVGSRDGKFWVIDEQELEPGKPLELGGPVTSLAWNVTGCWLVTVGSSIYRVDERGSSHRLVNRLEGDEPGLIACSSDGSLYAVRRGESLVEAYTLPEASKGSGTEGKPEPGSERIASVRYQDRKVIGLAFGPKRWLGIGLDQGDGNKVSLRTEAVYRTKPFAGRPETSWMLSVSVKGAEARRQKSKRRVRQELRPRVFSSERELDEPNRQTLTMLGMVAVATVGMWAAAYLKCNAHPPESKKPKPAPTEQLASRPKDAAIEVIQRWESLDYAGAMELAKGSALEQLRKEQQRCLSDKLVCDQRRKEVEGKVVTMAEVLSRSGNRARTRVTTRVGSNEPRRYLVEVESEGRIWKAVSREPWR